MGDLLKCWPCCIGAFLSALGAIVLYCAMCAGQQWDESTGSLEEQIRGREEQGGD